MNDNNSIDIDQQQQQQGHLKCPVTSGVVLLVDSVNSMINPDHGDIVIGKSEQEQVEQHKTFFKLHRMNKNITKSNVMASYLGSFLSICFFVFINVAQPFILNSLGIPDNQQGNVSGNLTFYNELTILIASHAWGVASDRYGRRIVYTLGMIIVGIGLLLYPFAKSLSVLIIFRLLFGIGAASCSSMLSAVLGDYVLFQDRGRASGFLGFAAGGGAVLGSLVLLKIPTLLQTSFHLSTELSGQLTYVLTAVMAFVGALLLFLFLKKFNPRDSGTILQKHTRNILVIFKEGLKAGKRPVLALAYGSGFIARGDSAIATTFLSLWIYNYALSNNGGNKDQALSSSGTISGIAQTCALFFALIAGYMMDKLNRVFAMVLLALIGCSGYFILAFSNDPLSARFFIGACIIGCAETGMVVSSTSLVAQESPPKYRGSVSGFFSQCGCVGILIASKVGGMYFDTWNGFPFALFGVFSAILSIWSLIVYFMTQFKSNRSPNFFKNIYLNMITNDDKEIISPPTPDEKLSNPLINKDDQEVIDSNQNL
ncbi:hypothetical protein DLAC_00307 [Tieghemostelium lacteum]|uniref:Major facilitator superfamily (MFS) profile domain-containing protein n=1 Tax=Tieghemostelium lacteum TaxID=361077 RepID=A0A152A9D9_TIELA|nr:hypothetical protein DLAC_00307 [Tieghemostelium lacteum]|eukprot:KYR02839.1 hypothetical protein DLAC_00307 [Tieghemostelium lacteum]